LLIDDPLFLVLFTLAVTLLGLSKGGLAGVGILSVPMLALAIPPVDAAGVLLPILLIQDAFTVWVYRWQWHTTSLKVLLPGAVFGILAGYFLAEYAEESILLTVLGTITLVFALRELLIRRVVDARPGTLYGVVCGALSGFTSTVVHAGSPPFQMYLLPQRLARDVFVATSVAFFAVVNVIKVPAFVALGQFTEERLILAAIFAPLALGAARLGVFIVRRIDVVRFYVIINALLAATGAKLLWDGIAGLIAA